METNPGFGHAAEVVYFPRMAPNFERRLFDLIESVSRAERDGSFSNALADSIMREFGPSLKLRSVAIFRPQGLRYEPTYCAGEPLWDVVDGSLSTRTVQRRLQGQLWWVQRGLKRVTPQQTEWFDLILIPVARNLQFIIGLLTNSLAGDEGEERETTFHVMGQLIRLFVDRHHQRQRLQEILTLARQQQLSLLQPELPRIPGFQVAGVSLPNQEVGGDYFQVIKLAPDLFALALADAKGKGFEAAVQVTGLHAGLRVVSETPFKVSHKVGLLNRSLAQGDEMRNLVSLFYAELDTQGRLLYVNCSHPPPFVVRAGGVIEELPDGGMFLGLSPDSIYRIGIFELRPGDVLVVYSDGWSELFNDQGEEFGADRLRETLRQVHRWEPQAVIDLIQASCDQFRGEAPYQDDRTLLVLKRDG